MQQGDYSSAPYYHHHYSNIPIPSPRPNLADHGTAPRASAPRFSTTGYPPADHAAHYNYLPHTHNPDPVPPPTARSYACNRNSSPNLPPPTNFNPSVSETPTPPAPPPPPAPSTFPSIESHGAYQPPAQPPPQSYYSPPAASYYQPPPTQPVPPSYSTALSAAPILNSNPNLGNSDTPYSFMHSSSAPHNPPHESSYSNSSKLGPSSSYFDDSYGNNSQGRTSLGSELYGKQSDASLYDTVRDDFYGDGVYAYHGGKVEPYGARGTAPKSSTWSGFDHYGCKDH